MVRLLSSAAGRHALGCLSGIRPQALPRCATGSRVLPARAPTLATTYRLSHDDANSNAGGQWTHIDGLTPAEAAELEAAEKALALEFPVKTMDPKPLDRRVRETLPHGSLGRRAQINRLKAVRAAARVQRAAKEEAQNILTPRQRLTWKFARWQDNYRFKHAHDPRSFPTKLESDRGVYLNGTLEKPRKMGAGLVFANLRWGTNKVQLVSRLDPNNPDPIARAAKKLAQDQLLSIRPYSAVVAYGQMSKIDTSHHKYNGIATELGPRRWDLELWELRSLGDFPSDVVVTKGALWPNNQRHLQLKFDPLLRERLRIRQSCKRSVMTHLYGKNVTEIETPILFKSTPEGAREFLVPTRRKNYSYALPQSPQQYKQILMTTGVNGYYQFAKCFRDEDHRADRQPEFTQLDIEVPWVKPPQIRNMIEDALYAMTWDLRDLYIPIDVDGRKHPSLKDKKVKPWWPDSEEYRVLDRQYPTLTYQQCMEDYGIDKPDLRIPRKHITNVMRLEGEILQKLDPEFIGKMTDLKDPILEVVRFRFNDRERTTADSAKLVRGFMDSIQDTTLDTEAGNSFGVFLYDSSKPLDGLSALGHESAYALASLESPDWSRMREGDVLFIRARKDEPFQGKGSTPLGRLRKALYDHCVTEGIIEQPYELRPLWVVDFPLFTKAEASDEEPGQGGSAGIISTHHPFTAPKPEELGNFEKLVDDPLAVVGDHYDLVINGIEIGGGSRRIHVAEMQEFVMRDVLRMTDDGVKQFSHLLDALRSGCPPHAGFALGWDRLMTLICDVPSLRDVMAFPKNNKGEDRTVGSPSKMTLGQRKTYHMVPEGREEKSDTAPASDE